MSKEKVKIVFDDLILVLTTLKKVLFVKRLMQWAKIMRL